MSSRRNVLILKFPYASLFGGGERHTLTLVGELRKRGFEFFLVASCPILLREFERLQWHQEAIWSPKEPVAKGSLLLFPLFAPFFFLRLLVILVRYRWKYGVRLLYCLSLTEKILVTVPARILGMEVLWVEHVTIERWLTLNPLKIFYQIFARLASIIVISQAIRDQLVRYLRIPTERITLIYYGLTLPRVHATTIQPRVNRNEFVIGTVARLEKEKGVEYLLKAFVIVQDVLPHARLLVVGEGHEKRHLEWVAKRLNIDRHVQFVGFQEDAESWIRHFDLFVLPSVRRESFGLVLLEAMANCRPVVATRIGGTNEIISHGNTGKLVPPQNPEALAEAILETYHHPEETRAMIERAYRNVQSTFSREHMIDQFEKLFIRCLRS